MPEHLRSGRRSRHALAGSTIALALVAAACTSSSGGTGGSGDDADAPTPVGEELGEGDRYEAVIRRTEGNVPHITGGSMADVTFGQGWASGEDRACDLADQVLKINGERARWHGPGEDGEHLESDLAWRAIGIADIAADDWPSASPEVVELVTAFADGWNAHLAEVGPSGLDGWCAGAEWLAPLEPVDVYAYGRSIAIQASGGALVQFIPSAQPPDDGTDEPAPNDDGGGDGGDGTDAGDDEPAEDDGEGEGDSAADAGDADANRTDSPGRLPGYGTSPNGTDDAGDDEALGPILPPADEIASNAWAIGTERSATGAGMLLGNPHFPWEGELRFWESHLTIPGELNIYGAQLSGLPGIGIGFTERFAWSHTVSAGNRFTAYTVDLVPGAPTSYRFGDEIREMTPQEITVEVLQEDGTVGEETRTLWSTHYGPVIDFPGFGWSDAQTITYRDANIDNDEIFDQFLAMATAGDLDQFIDAHARHQGVPLFNTIAASADGRAWYADTSATPNLSDEALAAYAQSLDEDPVVAIAAENGAVLLDGSDPRFEWEEAEGARDPGLVPFDEMPQIERADYTFNANDSFWLPHAEATIEGDFSRLHGEQRTARSPRTRENAVLLDDSTAEGPAGDDGLLTLDELTDVALANTAYTPRVLLEEVVARCDGAGPEILPQLPATNGDDLPQESVFVGAACSALAGWDGIYDTDRIGPPIWRELMHRFDQSDLADAGPLWAEPFDPERPVDTPSGLAPAPDGEPDLVLEHLARAVQILDRAGVDVDATLGELQFARRDGEAVPIHGGDNRDGAVNIVGFGGSASILDPEITGLDAERVAPDSPLRRVEGDPAYLVNNGTSFLLAVELGEDGPDARAHLTFGNSEDRSHPDYREATRRFSDKQWREIPFRPDEVEAAAIETKTVRG